METYKFLSYFIADEIVEEAVFFAKCYQALLF